MITLFITIRWLDVLDILLVSILLYQLYNLVKGSAAINILVGILLIYFLWIIVKALDMQLFSSMLGRFIDVGVITLIIVFQQELRKFLLFIGSSDLFSKYKIGKNLFDFNLTKPQQMLDISSIVKASKNLSETKTGAIIVITKNSDLKFYSNTGDQLDAAISVRMLESIFYKNSPLHDGAIIITDNKIKAARCVLPVTENTNFPPHLGMRHRAAVGISEVSDAIAISVSEQTGEISVAKESNLNTNLSPEKLREFLEKEFS